MPCPSDHPVKLPVMSWYAITLQLTASFKRSALGIDDITWRFDVANLGPSEESPPPKVTK